MKKIICAVLLLTILALVLAGCGHEHTWEGGDCTKRAVCAECGEEGEKIHEENVLQFFHQVNGDHKMFYICEKCDATVARDFDIEEMAKSQIIGNWLLFQGVGGKNGLIWLIVGQDGTVSVASEAFVPLGDLGTWKFEEGEVYDTSRGSKKQGSLIFSMELGGVPYWWKAEFEDKGIIEHFSRVIPEDDGYLTISDLLVRMG